MLKNHFGKVYKHILEQLEENPGLIFLVVDPPNQSPEIAGKMAKAAYEAGCAAIAVGGSVGAQGRLLDETIERIKENSSLPVILFPGNIATLSPKADAVYFMSLLNSNDPYYISGAQISASYPLRRMGIEVIPTSYIIVEPGMAAGWVGRAQLIPRNVPYLAAITALAGQYMGSHFIILEAGGSSPEHVPLDMIALTKEFIDVPLIVAGGVKKPEQAEACTKAGADIIHVGAAIEKLSDDYKKAYNHLASMVKSAKTGARKRSI